MTNLLDELFEYMSVTSVHDYLFIEKLFTTYLKEEFNHKFSQSFDVADIMSYLFLANSSPKHNCIMLKEKELNIFRYLPDILVWRGDKKITIYHSVPYHIIFIEVAILAYITNTCLECTYLYYCNLDITLPCNIDINLLFDAMVCKIERLEYILKIFRNTNIKSITIDHSFLWKEECDNIKLLPFDVIILR